MRENKLKQMLKRGEVVLGPFVSGYYPGMVEIIGIAGFDFSILDMEHGPLDVQHVEDMCRAADAVGLSPVVRVRENDPPQILRALDIGSAGVQVPQIETKEDALHVVRAAKYSPLGERGLSLYTRAAVYSAEGMRITDKLNEASMVIIHVEGIKGIQNLDEILTVPHLDVIFLRPYDLSQSLGIPGQVRDPRVIEAMEQAVEKIRNAGLAVGTFADSAEIAKTWIDVGVQYVSISVDVGIFLRACREIVREVRGS